MRENAGLMFGGRLMAGQGTLDPCIEVQILAPESAGPLAQRQSGRLITGWSQVRILQGPLERMAPGAESGGTVH